MVSLLKRIAAFAVLSALFLATALIWQDANAEIYLANSTRAWVLREVFDSRVIEGLSNLSADRFDSALERAMDLAQEVEEHKISVQQARNALSEILIKMDRGESLAGLPDPEFEVVGVIVRGSGLKNSPEYAAVSGVKKSGAERSRKPDTKPEEE
jgi:hypothetical protein